MTDELYQVNLSARDIQIINCAMIQFMHSMEKSKYASEVNATFNRFPLAVAEAMFKQTSDIVP